MKITDSGFTLPQVFAEQKVTTLDTGATQPIVILGRDKQYYTLTKCVAKPKSFPRMSVLASLAELSASFIASEVGLKVPSPAIIEITEEFCELYRGETLFQNLYNSIGLNFGTIYMEGMTAWNSDKHLLEKFHKELLNIFIFDMFIENTDRRVDKPNMFTNREEVFIYDHETAFSFIYSVIPNSNSWRLSDYDKYVAEGHVLYHFLKGREFVSDDFFEGFNYLNSDFWDKAQSIIPEAWQCENFVKIKDYLSQRVNSIGKYKEEIKRLLS